MYTRAFGHAPLERALRANAHVPAIQAGDSGALQQGAAASC